MNTLTEDRLESVLSQFGDAVRDLTDRSSQVHAEDACLWCRTTVQLMTFLYSDKDKFRAIAKRATPLIDQMEAALKEMVAESDSELVSGYLQNVSTRRELIDLMLSGTQAEVIQFLLSKLDAENS